MSYFIEKGVALQENAKNAKEACGAMATSCNKCFKAAYCDETKCPIMMAHKARMIYFEAMEMAKRTEIILRKQNEIKCKQRDEKSKSKRHYTKMSSETKLRQKLRKFLDAQYSPKMDRLIELIIDQASVANEQYHFKECYNILYQNRLYTIAYQYYKIYSEV